MNIFTFIFSFLTIDFICTMVNKYVFKDGPSGPEARSANEDDEKDTEE